MPAPCPNSLLSLSVVIDLSLLESSFFLSFRPGLTISQSGMSSPQVTRPEQPYRTSSPTPPQIIATILYYVRYSSIRLRRFAIAPSNAPCRLYQDCPPIARLPDFLSLSAHCLHPAATPRSPPRQVLLAFPSTNLNTIFLFNAVTDLD